MASKVLSDQGAADDLNSNAKERERERERGGGEAFLVYHFPNTVERERERERERGGGPFWYTIDQTLLRERERERGVRYRLSAKPLVVYVFFLFLNISTCVE